MRVAVNTTTIESAPVFGAAAALGADVDLISGKIPRLLDGSADAATNAETQALLLSLRNPELRIVLTVAECGYRIVARADSGVRRAADLRGKRVGTVRHSSAHFYLAKTLASAGLNEADAVAIDVPVEAMPTTLGRGEVDALSIWEPVAEAAIAAVNGRATTLAAPALFRERFNLNTTVTVLSDPARRARLVRFVGGVIRAAARIREQPRSAWPLLASKINLAEPTIERLWPQFRFPAHVPEDLLPLLIEEERWLASHQERTPRPPDTLATLIDGTVLRDARALAG